MLRRSEQTRLSSASDDEVAGLRAQSQRAERAIKFEWVNGGQTNLNNLTLLCAYDHHNFLARGWTCWINTDGLPEWIPLEWVDRAQKSFWSFIAAPMSPLILSLPLM